MLKVIYDLAQFKPSTKPLVTIGTYDGVHSGHKQVIQRLVESAKEQGVESMLITFDPHPREALGLGNISLLSLLEEKVKLLESTDLDYLLVLPFTHEFSQLSAREFIHEYLVKTIKISGIILGYDHKFGNKREGTIELLKQELNPLGVDVEEIPAQAVDSIIVSSTKIRTALVAGNTMEANRLLGYHYAFEGTVVHGFKNGRKLGYPTANLLPNSPSKLIPGKGVYTVICSFDESKHQGMMKQTLGVLFCLISFWGISQPDRTYRLSELENAVKDSVYSLDLRREKLYAIPAIVFELPNLRQLNLSKNKLELLGDSITLLKKLNRLDLSHNKFKAIPYAIFRLENLTHLSLGMNQIERIPDEIAYLTQLESLDLFDNAITYFSPSLKMLATLKKLDIQGVMYGHVMHAKLVEDFKHCILLIDPPCSCMD